MASSNNKQLISIAKPHTIKKFELIESYIETWVQKLLNNPKCKRIVFIDCICLILRFFQLIDNIITNKNGEMLFFVYSVSFHV